MESETKKAIITEIVLKNGVTLRLAFDKFEYKCGFNGLTSVDYNNLYIPSVGCSALAFLSWGEVVLVQTVEEIFVTEVGDSYVPVKVD